MRERERRGGWGWREELESSECAGLTWGVRGCIGRGCISTLVVGGGVGAAVCLAIATDKIFGG